MAAKPIWIECDGCGRGEMANEASLQAMSQGEWLECMDCCGTYHVAKYWFSYSY